MLQTLLIFHCLGIYNKDASRRESAQKFVDQLVKVRLWLSTCGGKTH